MKIKLLFTAILIISISTYVMSQFRVGAETRVILNNPHVSGISAINDYAKPLFGTSAGITAEHTIGNGWSVKSGMFYTNKGFSVSEGTQVNVFGMNIPVGLKMNTRVNYLEFPVYLKYELEAGKARPFIQAGPGISYALNGEIQPVANVLIDWNLPSIPLNFNDDFYQRNEWAGNVGIGVEYDVSENGKISGLVNYSHSFSSLLNNPIADLNIRNKALSLGLGYSMSF